MRQVCTTGRQAKPSSYLQSLSAAWRMHHSLCTPLAQEHHQRERRLLSTMLRVCPSIMRRWDSDEAIPPTRRLRAMEGGAGMQSATGRAYWARMALRVGPGWWLSWTLGRQAQASGECGGGAGGPWRTGRRGGRGTASGPCAGGTCLSMSAPRRMGLMPLARFCPWRSSCRRGGGR